MQHGIICYPIEYNPVYAMEHPRGPVCRNLKPSVQEQSASRNISNEEHGSICYPIKTRHK